MRFSPSPGASTAPGLFQEQPPRGERRGLIWKDVPLHSFFVQKICFFDHSYEKLKIFSFF